MIHLNRTERRTAIIGTLILALWATYSFVIEPVKSRTTTLHRVIPKKQEELSSLYDQAKRFRSLQQDTSGLQERIAQQDPAFELLPHLEMMLETLRIKESVTQMKEHTIPLDSSYSENIVEILLDSVTLEQIVAFVQSIETSEALLQTRSLHLTHNPANEERLNCTLSVHHPKMTQQQG